MSQKSDFQLSEGVEVEELSGELYEKFCSQMKSFALGFIKLQPYNQMLPRCFLQYQKQIKEFQSRPDDVWVASFPKCGKKPNKHTYFKIYKILQFRTLQPLRLSRPLRSLLCDLYTTSVSKLIS